MSAEWQFEVGTKATLILNSRLCGSLRSPRAVVYSASKYAVIKQSHVIHGFMGSMVCGIYS